MDFVPDGWLASFSEAVELYETTRFGERTTEYDKPILRLFALQKAQREGQRLTDDEEKELSALIPVARNASLVMSQRRAEALEQLQQKLYDEVIKAAIQDQDSGRFYPVPGSFWTSEKAKAVKSRGLGYYSSNKITGFGGYGPVRICREDVIKAAKQASDPPDEALVPKQGELKKDYILRALNMKEVRSISAKEGKELAPFWLKAKGFPCAPEDIAAESRRMTSLMSGLARPQDGKPKRTKPQAVAKSEQSQSKVGAKQ